MATDLKRRATITPKKMDVAINRAVQDALDDVGVEKFTCYLCGHLLPKNEFYKNTDPLCQTSISPICKDCVSKIVYQIDKNGEKHNPTPQSMQDALRYLNKPWLDKLYESSLVEAANQISGKKKSDVWNSYIKNISMKNYFGMTWKDGDVGGNVASFDERTVSNSKEVKEMYEINRRTVISALGYDPFESVNENDKPLMYSKLVGFLDESTNDDELKLGACVEITHSLNQSERINYVINDLQKSPESIIKNSSTIKALEDTKNKIFNSTLALAKDNGISIKHSNHNSKGANQWTGKVKELKEMNLREQEVNAFDIGTSEGMMQVAEANAKAIFTQLKLDENDYTDMIKTQKEMLTVLQNKNSELEEELRIYRRENKDLKDFMEEKNIIDSKGEIIYD